jgi:hypothetical protein
MRSAAALDGCTRTTRRIACFQARKSLVYSPTHAKTPRCASFVPLGHLFRIYTHARASMAFALRYPMYFHTRTVVNVRYSSVHMSTAVRMLLCTSSYELTSSLDYAAVYWTAAVYWYQLAYSLLPSCTETKSKVPGSKIAYRFKRETP